MPIQAWMPEGIVGLDDLPPEVAVRAIPRQGPLPPEFADVEFLVPPSAGRRVREALPALERLKVVQAMTAGVEWLLPHVPDGVTVCTARGARDVAVAEWVVAAVLSAAKRLPELHDAQRERRWQPLFLDEVAGRRALIVGHGSIGRAVERRLRALGMDVQGVARRVRPGVADAGDLPQLLPIADYVIVLAPHTEETTHLVDVAAMRDGAVLINASRGALVDTDALVRELASGRLRAVLDVTDPEPLPYDHPLWTSPGVTITSHNAGDTGDAERRAHELVTDQLRRYAAGEPLLNVVSGGY